MIQQINLLNPAFRKQKQPFSAVNMLQGMAMLLVGALLFFAYAQHQFQALKDQVARTEKNLADERERLTRYTAEYAPKQNSLLADEVKSQEAKLKARQEIIGLLKGGVAGNTQGYSEYLRAFARQSQEGLWLTGFSISATQMTLSGRALRPELVPAYIRRLNREKIMQGRQFASLKISLPAVVAGAVPAPVAPVAPANLPALAGATAPPTVASVPEMPRYLEFSLLSELAPTP